MLMAVARALIVRSLAMPAFTTRFAYSDTQTGSQRTLRDTTQLQTAKKISPSV